MDLGVVCTGRKYILDFDIGICFLYENINRKWKICMDCSWFKENKESVYEEIYLKNKLTLEFDVWNLFA